MRYLTMIELKLPDMAQGYAVRIENSFGFVSR